MSELTEYPKILQTLFKNRGLTTKKEVEDFLHPDYENFSDPFLMHDMKKAVDRILLAFEKNEHIAIYADYDADGVPGAALFADFFNQLGFENFSVFIPHRHDDGYGFHKHVVEDLVQQKTSLIITIDLGVTAIEVVDFANQNDVDVIITDHHEVGEKLPEAHAIVNPKLGDYPDRMLCGAATIFQVVRAVIHELRNTDHPHSEVVKSWPEGYHKWWLDLVGIATVSDMVPLVKENRILASYGLRVARKSRRPGLHALANVGRFSLQTLEEQDIGFGIAPRINSASRMEHALSAFTLLSTSDRAIANEYAKKLNRLNDQRKRVTAATSRQANKILEERKIGNVIVVGHPDWNPGVLSILAGKLMEKYGRTTFVWTNHGADLIKGSTRATSGQSVLELMKHAKDFLVKFGGHEAAGGFTCGKDTLHLFEKKVHEAHDVLYADLPDEKGPGYVIDAELMFSEIDRSLHRMIRQLAPFGMGNPEPVFLFSEGALSGIRQFGKHGDHLEVIVKDKKGRLIKAVAFYKTAAQYGYTPSAGEPIRIVGNLTLSRFLGREELRIDLVDILPAA